MNNKSKKVSQSTKGKVFKASQTLAEKYPNPGQTPKIDEVVVHENNHFKNHDPADIRKKYMEFTVFMTSLNNTLELDKTAKVDQFAARVHDLVMAAAKV